MVKCILTPPHSKDAEMMVLGCMLSSNNGFNLGSNELDESNFFIQEHKFIYQALNSVFKQGKPADIYLISEELKRQDQLKSVGGFSYLTTLAQYAGTSTYIEEYIKMLKEQTSRRSLFELGVDLQNKSLGSEKSNKIILSGQEKLKLIERKSGVEDKFPIRFLNEFDQNFLLAEPPKKQMLLEYANAKGITTDFLPSGIVAMLVGAGGIGKTHLLAQLAISCATGSPWLDSFTPIKQGSVFLGLGENRYDDIHRILYKASKKLRRDQPDLIVNDPIMEASKRIAAYSFCGQQAAFIENGHPSHYYRNLKMRLAEIAPQEGWSLIILDPVSRLLGADSEIDNAAATQFIALLEELTIELPGNPTVLFAHHVNKSAIRGKENQDQTAARGASALTDGVRWQVNFTCQENSTNLLLKMTKSNFTARIDDIFLEKENDGFLKNNSIQTINGSNIPKTNKKNPYEEMYSK